jgi:hypothetical protein
MTSRFKNFAAAAAAGIGAVMMTGPAFAGDAASCQNVRLSDVGWTDITAITAMTGAILDINLKGQLVYPLAAELARRRVPFMFLSGYALINMPEAFRAYPRLAKPANSKDILRGVQNMLSPKPV